MKPAYPVWNVLLFIILLLQWRKLESARWTQLAQDHQELSKFWFESKFNTYIFYRPCTINHFESRFCMYY